MPWKPRPVSNLQRENDALKTTIGCLRRDLSNKAQFVDRLEFLLRERMETIDALHGTIDQLRAANRRLDEEAEYLAQLVSAERIPLPPSGIALAGVAESAAAILSQLPPSSQSPRLTAA